MDPQNHLQWSWWTGSFGGGLVIHELDQGQNHFPGNRDPLLIKEALAERSFLGVDRKAQLDGLGYPFQSQIWILADFRVFSDATMGRELRQVLIQENTNP